MRSCIMYNCLSLPFIELQVDSLNKNRSEMSKSRVYGLKEEREREKKKDLWGLFLESEALISNLRNECSSDHPVFSNTTPEAYVFSSS